MTDKPKDNQVSQNQVNPGSVEGLVQNPDVKSQIEEIIKKMQEGDPSTVAVGNEEIKKLQNPDKKDTEKSQ